MASFLQVALFVIGCFLVLVKQSRELLRWGESSSLKGELGVEKSLCVSGQDIDVVAVKDAGKRLGKFTVNDVMLAAFTGALRQYLTVKEGKTVAPGRTANCALPVNLRSGSEEYIGNKIGGAFTVRLPVGIADPAKRLEEVSRGMNAAKRSPEADMGFYMGKLSLVLPTWASAKIMATMTSSIECVFTNVRGPDIALHLKGHSLGKTLGFVPPPPGVALGVAVGSFYGRVMFSVSADKTLLGNDAEELTRLFEEELSVYLEATS